MQISLTQEQQTQLEELAKASRQVRHWRRFQAVLLVARGQTASAGCGPLRMQPGQCLQLGSSLA
jgi:hypothetical protein